MLTPFWLPIMLWMISVRSTVFPTPAPPNRPAFPPRSRGTSTSMTLMPVSKTADWVDRRASAGGVPCAVRVEVSEDLDGHRPVLRVQQRVDGRQERVELNVDDTATYRDHRPEVRRTGGVFHVCPR